MRSDRAGGTGAGEVNALILGEIEQFLALDVVRRPAQEVPGEQGKGASAALDHQDRAGRALVGDRLHPVGDGSSGVGGIEVGARPHPARWPSAIAGNQIPTVYRTWAPRPNHSGLGSGPNAASRGAFRCRGISKMLDQMRKLEWSTAW